MSKALIYLCAMCVLSGCATSYQSDGLTGGFLDLPGPGSLITVQFSGNGFSSGEMVTNFALLRCAEIARDKNKPYFLLYDSLTNAAQNRPASLPRQGNMYDRAKAVGYILLLDEMRPGALRTDAVLLAKRGVTGT